MEYIPVALFVSVVLFLIGCVVNFVANKLSEKPSRFVKLVVMVAFVAMLLTTMAYADETKGVITFVTPIIENGKAIALVDVDCDDGNYWQYKAVGRIEIGGKVKLTIIDGEVVAVNDTEEEAPSSIPAIIGIVATVAFVVTVANVTDRRCDK